MTRLRRRHPLASALVYAAFVLLVGTWPRPVDYAARPAIDDTIAGLRARGATDALTYASVESIANVAFFVPLGLLVALALPRLRLLAVAACAALSALIEASQALFLPARYATIADVVANTVGGAIGALIALSIGIGIERQRRRSRPRPEPPVG